jgi:outer membrane protein assembly factor BamA
MLRLILFSLLWTGFLIAEPLRVQHAALVVQVTELPDALQTGMRQVLQEQLEFATDSAASAPLADDLAYFARGYLVDRGWLDAKVDWKLEQGEVRLACEPGSPVLLGPVTWLGDSAPVAHEELANQLLRSLKEAHSKKDLPWVAPLVESGASLVKRRLQAEGYLAATATLEPKLVGSLMHVAVQLKLGPQTLFGEIALTGCPEPLAAKTQEKLAALRGKPCNAAVLEAVSRELLIALQRDGWLEAKVEQEQQALRVLPGERTRIASVAPASELSAGAQRVLLAIFLPLRGRLWDARELEFRFRQALDTGLFLKLDYTAETVPGEPGARLSITGEESKRYQLGTSGGFDTFLGGFVGVEFTQLNVWDLGAKFRFAAEYGGFGPAGSLRLASPAILGSQYSGSAELGIQHMLRFDYVSTTVGMKVAVERRVSLPFSYSFYGGILAAAASGPELSAAELGPEQYGLTSLGASLQLDFRDSPVLPTRGWLLETKGELNQLIGDNSQATYLRTDIRATYTHSFGDGWRFAAGAHALSILGPSVTDLPIDLRIFNGGARAMRSFGEREMGQLSRTGSTPLGGTAALTVSAELSKEVISNLDVAVFCDYGGITFDGTSGIPEDLRYAPGIGLRYKLPFGPLRIDYGWNAEQRAGESSGTLHVALGFPF